MTEEFFLVEGSGSFFMLTFIVKYWVEFLFGLVAAGLTYACKKLYKLYQDEKQHQKDKAQEEFVGELKALIIKNGEDCKENNEQLNKEIHTEIKSLTGELGIVKNGILNMQGKIFKNQCREYLEEDRKVTLAEYESLEEDHAIYNSLGGNHDGDALFAMVEEKVKRDLSE